MRFKYVFGFIAPLLVPACVAPTETAMTGVDYKTMVARSLGYYAEAQDVKHYSISEPWRPVIGQLMVCAREDVPNGGGGFAPTTDYSMYQFNEGKIAAVIKDNTLFGCPNRQYFDLPRAARPT